MRSASLTHTASATAFPIALAAFVDPGPFRRPLPRIDFEYLDSLGRTQPVAHETANDPVDRRRDRLGAKKK
jgi:hypothetical protein